MARNEIDLFTELSFLILSIIKSVVIYKDKNRSRINSEKHRKGFSRQLFQKYIVFTHRIGLVDPDVIDLSRKRLSE